MFAAIILEAEWQWLLCAAVAFVYGLAVMLTVIALLVKSAQRHYKAEQKGNAEIES
ncbi:MAG TPA: hypothetical protein VKA70_22430 [Blastocatellia bacterium]|nr:hypothetical protein [Blastocatellia bacterium]